jgi:hypothetical protein
MLRAALLASGSFPFDMTCYYEKEMGSPLERRWFCFGLADPSGLSRWKRDCMEIEESFSERRRRRVNLDPGYLDLGKLVLASCKAAPDKIYLSDGVYAHTCLRYGRGGFAAPEHSFADFIDGRFNGFFMEARALYRKALR